METDVLAENRHLAEHNHEKLQGAGIRSVDVMGTTGAGKTALIIKLSKILMDRGFRVAAIAGDVTGQETTTASRPGGSRPSTSTPGRSATWTPICWTMPWTTST